MNNADLPAMPGNDISVEDDHGFLEEVIKCYGLTKREYFAGLALQGLLNGNQADRRSSAKLAVTIADSLLAELEKKS